MTVIMYKNKHKAITLIELLVSIGVIMATMGMVATFIKYQKPHIELSGAANDLKSALNQARALSLTTQAQHGVKFFLATNSYQILRLSSGEAVIASTTLPVNVEYESIGAFSGDTVSFNSAGGASSAGAIILQNSFNQTRQIIISPSGYVHIE